MLTVAVARYKEDISWLSKLPPEAKIYLYNKGPELSADELADNVELIPLPNIGRETHTYLYHLSNNFKGEADGITVFTQGGPFEHSPRFLEAFDHIDSWKDLQTLSVQYLEDHEIPPRVIVSRERSDWIEDVPLRCETFSLLTWSPIGFIDAGCIQNGETYRQMHALPRGTNLMSHFLSSMGLTQLAESADAADLGVLAYGGIFAVKNSLITKFLDKYSAALPTMDIINKSHPVYGYFFERTWLHFFGEPFLVSPRQVFHGVPAHDGDPNLVMMPQT